MEQLSAWNNRHHFLAITTERGLFTLSSEAKFIEAESQWPHQNQVSLLYCSTMEEGEVVVGDVEGYVSVWRFNQRQKNLNLRLRINTLGNAIKAASMDNYKIAIGG